MSRVNCIFCFMPEGMRINCTKKGSPSLKCGHCGVMVFMYERMSFRGLIAINEFIAEQREAGTLEPLIAAADVQAAAQVRQFPALAGQPAPSPAPVPAPVSID